MVCTCSVNTRFAQGLERWEGSREPFTAMQSLSMLPSTDLKAVDDALLRSLTYRHSRCLLVVGQLTSPADVAAAAAIAEALGWPVATDVLSGAW